MDLKDMLLKTASDLEATADRLEQTLTTQSIFDKSKEAGFSEDDVTDIIGKLGSGAFEAVDMAVKAVDRNKQASLGNPTLFSPNNSPQSNDEGYHEFDLIHLNGGY